MDTGSLAAISQIVDKVLMLVTLGVVFGAIVLSLIIIKMFNISRSIDKVLENINALKK